MYYNLIINMTNEQRVRLSKFSLQDNFSCYRCKHELGITDCSKCPVYISGFDND